LVLRDKKVVGVFVRFRAPLHFLHCACPAQLSRATAFLLAPLPNRRQCPATGQSLGGRLARQFYQSGQGRNVRGSQVSHALKVVPLQLLRRLPPGTGSGTGCSSGLVSDSDSDATADIQLLAHLYVGTVRGNGNGSSAVGSVVDSCPSAAGSSGGLLALEGMGVDAVAEWF
jgi:hypothetical protein